MKTTHFAALFASAALLLSLGCTKPAAQGGSSSSAAGSAPNGTLEQVLRRGVLRVGFSTFVPWAMQDKKGAFIGYEIDVANRLAKDMGVKVEFAPTQWSGIIPALLSGKFDIIIGGMSIQPERALKVDFTIPYEYSGMSIVAARGGKADAFAALADFNRPDVVLAVRQGTTAVDAAKKFLPKAQLRLFDQEAQTIQEVLSGRADAVVASEPFPAFQSLKYPDKLRLPFPEPFTKEPIAFAVRKGDQTFLNFLDSWIRFVDNEGWLAERHHYWFRTDAWKSQME